MRKIFTIAFLAIIATVYSFAQVNISGIVVDKQTSQPLADAYISVKGTNDVSFCNSEGRFNISLKEKGKYRIMISHIAYKSVNLNINIDKDISDIKIEMETMMNMLPGFEINASRADEKTPMAYSDISSEKIAELSTGKDLPEIINLTPSLVSSSDNGLGIGYTDFRIRGSNLTRINVTINGIPLNDSESQNVFFANMPDFSSSVDDIQIQRGIGTSSNGTAAFGATVNFKTKDIEHEPYFQTSLIYGSFNTLRSNIQLGSGLIKDKFSFNVGLSSVNSDGYIERATDDMYSLYFDGAYIGKKFYAKIVNYTGKQRTYQAWNGISPEMMAIDRRYNVAGEIYENDEVIGFYDNETDNYLQSTTHLITSYNFSEKLKANISLHYTYGNGYYENYKNNKKIANYQENIGDILTPVNDDIKRTDLILQKWLDNDFYGAVYSLDYTAKRWNLNFGGGYNQYEGDHFGKIIWAKDATVALDNTWYFSDAIKKDFNTFLKVNFNITNELNIFGDVQYRYIDYRINGNRDDLTDITQAHKYNFVNPKAGILWQNKKNRAYASVALSNREPNRDNFTDADVDKVPNPEQLTDYELGYKRIFNRAVVAATLYYMDYKDQLVLTGKINNVGDAVMVNVDNSFRTGIELETFVEILKNRLFWTANISFSKNIITDYVQYVDNSNYWDDPENNEYQITEYYKKTNISFSPSIIGASELKLNIIKGLSATLTSKYVGKQYIDNCSDEEQVLDAYFINNIKFDYKLALGNDINRSSINFFISVNNIFNVEYETNAWLYRYYYDGELMSSSGYFPQAGINIFGGIAIRL